MLQWKSSNWINRFEILCIRWWRDLGFKEKLAFSRDRLMENYLWAMGIVSEPQFSKCRIGLTKFVCILTAIDDIYDIYGSLDELEYFTDAVDRYNKNLIFKFTSLFLSCLNHHLDDKQFFFFPFSLSSSLLIFNNLSRWELKAMENLPEYMKVCYVALLDFANETVCGVIKDHGLNTLPYVKAEVSFYQNI